MKGFLPATAEELLEVSGRGGSPARSSSSSSSSSSPSKPSTVEKARTDAAIAASEIKNANALVAAKVPYGGNNTVGTVNTLTASSYDCTGAMSATTGKPYQPTAALVDPATQKAAGYVNAVSNSQPGTWTVVRYTDPESGQTVGHAQMTMGNGKYFDSVPANSTREGPSLTQKSTLDYLASKGVTPTSVTYLRPTN